MDKSVKHSKKIYATDLSPRELVNLSIQTLSKRHKQKALPLLRLASALLNEGWKTDATSKAHYYDGLPMLASALLNEGRKPEAEKYLHKAVPYSSAYNVYLKPSQNENHHLISDLKSDQQEQGPMSCFMQNIDVIRRIESFSFLYLGDRCKLV